MSIARNKTVLLFLLYPVFLDPLVAFVHSLLVLFNEAHLPLDLYHLCSTVITIVDSADEFHSGGFSATIAACAISNSLMHFLFAHFFITFCQMLYLLLPQTSHFQLGSSSSKHFQVCFLWLLLFVLSELPLSLSISKYRFSPRF